MDVSDAVGRALKVFNTSLVKWYTLILPNHVGSAFEDWCAHIRRSDVALPLSQYDSIALLDVFLTGWDSVFGALLPR
jgi:hypothetical protein